MPKPKGANKETYAASHARLLAAATALFETEGYEAVTTEQIAALAGVANGSLFHHYKSKRALFIAVHNTYQLALIEQIEAAAAAARDPADRFDRVWRAYLASTENAGMRRILLLDGPHVIGLEALRARDRETAFAYFEEQIEAIMSAGQMPRRDVRALSVILFGALDQAAFEIADFPEDKALRASLFEAVAQTIEALKQVRPEQ
jgi:AcrR family transcriptional regulator